MKITITDNCGTMRIKDKTMRAVSPSGRCPYCGDRCYTRLWDNLVICDVCCTKYYLFKS